MAKPKEQMRFWFAHARREMETVNLGVAAFTALQARRQVRKRLGPGFTIAEINPIAYPNAWVLNHAWRPQAVRVFRSSDAVDPVDGTGQEGPRA